MGFGGQMKSITENTLLPISLIIAIIGGIGWLTNLAAETHANTESLREVRVHQEMYNKDAQMIRESIIRIEESIKRKGK